VVGVKTIPAMKNAKLIMARNPWGKDSYYGAYGAFSPEASNPKVTGVISNIADPDDGLIYVPINQFKVSFENVNVNFKAENMKFDYYLKVNDSTEETSREPEDPDK